MKRLVFALSAFLLSLGVSSADTTKPWTFWYWMYGAVSEEGIKADLQAMKEVGLGGCYLMPIRGAAERPEYEGKADALSNCFWKMVDCAFAQADSLGLGMGIHVCDGFALAGGPWITPEESMQKVVWTDTVIHISKRGQSVVLPSHAVGYQGYYEDIAAYAVEVFPEIDCQPVVGGTIRRNEKSVFRTTEPGYILFEYPRPVTVRSMEVIPSGNNLQSQRFLVEASEDGKTFKVVRQLCPPRQGWQNTDQNYTYALPETTARFFRLSWTPEGTEPGAEDLDAAKWSPVLKVNDIRLSSQPRIDLFEAKNGSVWRIAHDSDVPTGLLPRVIALSPDLSLPVGDYRILRFGHTSTGHTNATAGGAKGLECDKFSAAAVGKQVDGWFGLFMQCPHHHVIKYLHVDSWECGSQNWSKNFAQEFLRRRGYDLLPYLPVYAGVPMPNGDEVLRDIRRTINELVNEVFFGTVRQKARDYGVLLSSESVAPTMVSDGMDHYKYVDVPMGEYWLNSPTHDKPNDMLDAISAAHVYGKRIVQAEGFTEVRGVWDETPASIKPLLDRNFALGMNRLFFHVNTHNPWMDRKPGMTLDGIGLFFQRDQTWFPEARGLVDYITRCQTLLQEGEPVVDIAVYTGEEMPRRAFTPDRVVSMLPGLFGSGRVASEQRRLANIGQPMEESPVGVRHTANILDLKDWVNPLHGYQYDSMNKDALLSQSFNYRVLVIPSGTVVSEEVKAKIAELEGKGVLIVDTPYQQVVFHGLGRDVDLPEGIAYAHRTTGSKEIYFLANQTMSHVTFKPVFRDSSPDAVIYDPVMDDYMAYEGTITLPPYGSCFVIFNPIVSMIPAACETAVRPLRTGVAPLWDVYFRESNMFLRNQQLFDWSQHEDDRIRYFSGHARYTTAWKLKKQDVPTGRTWLSFPNVKDIAHVWINGKDCGIAWTAPYEVEITGALKKGKNKIEIEVVNTWHNALRGADQGKAPYNGIWTNAKYRTKGNDLLPAGLLVQPEIKIEQ